MKITNITQSTVIKVTAYLLASGVLAEILDVLIETLSTIRVSDKLLMGLMNIVLILIIRGKDAIKKK